MRLGAVAVLAALAPPAGALPSVVVDWLGPGDGLPAIQAHALARDAHGYLWIGSEGGLVRHDGDALTVLRRDPDRPGSLPGNNVLALTAAADGSVWAAISGQGLVRIQGTEIRRRWRSGTPDGTLRGRWVWSLAEACDGSMWGVYATDGLVVVDPDSGAARHLAPGSGGLPEGGFGLQLHVDRDCRLWLVRTDGLWRVHETRKGPRVEPVLRAGERTMPTFIAMAIDDGGRLWIGGEDRLLGVDVDAAGDSVRVVVARDFDRVISVVRRARSGRLWLGFRHGAALFDPATDRVQPVVGSEDRLAGLQVNDILPAPEGGVWIATEGGVARLPPGWRGFRALPMTASADGGLVTAVAADGGGIWAGTSTSRVERIDPARGTRTRLRAGDDDAGGEILDLAVDAGAVWVLRRLSLTRHDRASGERRRVRVPGPDGERQFEFAQRDGSGGLWLADDAGRLTRLDPDGRELDAWSPAAAAPRALPADGLRAIRRGPDGRWWLLGADALYRQNGAGAFEPVHRAASGQHAAFALDGDHVWLATDATLQRFRIERDGLRRVGRYTAGDGLPAGRVLALVPRGERLWLVTSVGLARLDIDSGRFRLHSRSEGLQLSQFTSRSTARLADGRFAAGTSEGVLLVDPEQAVPVDHPPPVHVTGVRTGERRIELAPGSDGAVSLDWHENSLALSFRALSYIDPTRNRYRVRLQGLDDDWRMLAGRTRVYYGRLPAGRYTFEVQAASAAGVWNRDGDRVAITIAPPPWASGPAWALYGLVVLAATGMGWRSLAQRRRRREALRQAEARQQLADRQRDTIARLSRSLEPEALARAIGEAVCELTGARACHVGYLHPAFPRDVRAFGADVEPADRRRFDQAVAGDTEGAVFRLDGGKDTLAAVWLPEPGATAGADRARLTLFVQAAGQVLENARLLVEVRQLAVQARAASDAKSEFLAAMSHEIRTPLHGLLGMMEVLERDESDAQRLETLRTMRDSGRQLQRMLSDVLDLSRIESGRLALEARPFELTALLERVIELHASRADADGLALRLRIDSDTPVMAVGDADAIAQIVGNLLSNAIKFTAAGGVELAVRAADDGGLVLAVSDTGPGIDPARRARLFEPFTQLAPAATRSHGGSGLGLAICRRLVDAMDGELTLASTPGRGSRFTVRLPLDGLAPQPPFRTALLDGFRLAARLSAPDARVLLRLARRWNIDFVGDPDGEPPADALIYCPRRADPAAVAALARRGVHCFRLDGGEEGEGTLLRRPLTESRVVGALLDLRLALSAG